MASIVSIFITMAKDPQHILRNKSSLRPSGFSHMVSVISNTDLSRDVLHKYGMSRPFRPDELEGLSKDKVISKLHEIIQAVKV